MRAAPEVLDLKYFLRSIPNLFKEHCVIFFMYQWDQLSKKYSLGDYTNKFILIPGILNNVKKKKGLILLDLGCGNGLLSIIFHEEGLKIVGIDISKEMIKLAQIQNPGPKYIHIDGTKYLSDKPFDIIISNMVACNIPKLDNLDEFFLSCFKNLKISGKLYFTNSATEFQKTCNFGIAKRTYPNNITEGCKFSVELKNLDDTWIGPFANYHWSENTIINSAKKSGLNLIKTVPLLSTSGQDNFPEKAKYSLYIFERE